MQYTKLLGRALTLGTMLLENGAEMYRVEESIQRLLYAYGVDSVQVFAIPNLIIVTIAHQEETVTRTARIHSRNTNFDVIIRLNDAIRRICRDKPTVAEIDVTIAALRNVKTHPAVVMFMSYTMMAFFFSAFFGGTWLDACFAWGAVVCSRIVCIQMERFHANTFFVTVVASFIHAFVAYSAHHYMPALHIDMIIIGTLMPLLPGVALITAVRDVIARDLVAGMVQGLDALLVATAIATGNVTAIYFFNMLWG